MSQKLQPLTSTLSRRLNAYQPNLACARCSFFIPHHALSTSPHRAFTATAVHLRQGYKLTQTSERSPINHTPIDDPLDFTELESDITRVLDRLKDEITKIRIGGRNPDIIESLRVNLIKGSKESERLGDLAQVIPRGREIIVLVGEKEHTKPVTSTLLSSPYSINPTPSPTDPLELHIPIPVPTRESRMASCNEVSKAGEKTIARIATAREAQKKRFQAMRNRRVSPDLLKRAKKRMEEVSVRGRGNVKTLVEGAQKVLMGG